MHFYKTYTQDFAISAPRCQDSFKGVANKTFITPSVISVPSKQYLLMESVKREHVQILSYVSYFMRTLDKCASSMEETIKSLQNTLGEDLSKELDELLGLLQVQFACLNSTDKALESVMDASMIMSCNLELARRDTTLKQTASHLHEHDRNRLRRSGFMSTDLFSPGILNVVEKKYEREKSPKRQKTEQKPIFQSKRSYAPSSSNTSFNQGSSSNSRFRNDFRSQQQKPSQPYISRDGRGGLRE